MEMHLRYSYTIPSLLLSVLEGTGVLGVNLLIQAMNKKLFAE